MAEDDIRQSARSVIVTMTLRELERGVLHSLYVVFSSDYELEFVSQLLRISEHHAGDTIREEAILLF